MGGKEHGWKCQIIDILIDTQEQNSLSFVETTAAVIIFTGLKRDFITELYC